MDWQQQIISNISVAYKAHAQQMTSEPERGLVIHRVGIVHARNWRECQDVCGSTGKTGNTSKQEVMHVIAEDVCVVLCGIVLRDFLFFCILDLFCFL